MALCTDLCESSAPRITSSARSLINQANWKASLPGCFHQDTSQTPQGERSLMRHLNSRWTGEPNLLWSDRPKQRRRNWFQEINWDSLLSRFRLFRLTWIERCFPSYDSVNAPAVIVNIRCQTHRKHSNRGTLLRTAVSDRSTRGGNYDLWTCSVEVTWHSKLHVIGWLMVWLIGLVLFSFFLGRRYVLGVCQNLACRIWASAWRINWIVYVLFWHLGLRNRNV